MNVQKEEAELENSTPVQAALSYITSGLDCITGTVVPDPLDPYVFGPPGPRSVPVPYLFVRILPSTGKNKMNTLNSTFFLNS
jgi:hypothetical protein